MLMPSTVRLFVCRQSADMRKSFDGLSGLCREHLHEDPTSGQVFVFFNRRRDQVKALWWDRTGWAIWHKRLEQGTFRPGDQEGPIGTAELSMILEGIVAKGIRRLPRFHLEDRCGSAS
jgi:transposase